MAAIAFATLIVSDRPAPVSMLKPWVAPPLVTAARLTPPAPIVTASVPVFPLTVIPANAATFVKFTVTVFPATVTPDAGWSDVDRGRVVAAVIVSRLVAGA